MRYEPIAAILIFMLAAAPIAPAQPAITETAPAGPLAQGEELFRQGEYLRAWRLMEQALNSDPDDAPSLHLMGEILLALGEFDDAKKHLEKAVSLDTEHVPYHMSLAVAYREKARRASFLSAGKWAGRWRKELERAFELEPDNIDIRRQLASYYLNAPGIGGGDKDKGKRIAEQTITIDELEGRLVLAYAHERRDETEMAIAEYEAALALDPNCGKAHTALGYIRLAEEDFAAAERYFRRGIEVTPDDPNAYDSLAEYYLQRAMYDEAIVWYREALAVDPRFSHARLELARLYEARGSTDQAIEHYKQILELTPGDIAVKQARKRLKKLKD